VARTAEALGVATRTIERLRQRFVEQGLEAALERKRRVKPPREVIFDGAFEARLIALACSQGPPVGTAGRYACWRTRPWNWAGSSACRYKERSRKPAVASPEEILADPGPRQHGIRHPH